MHVETVGESVLKWCRGEGDLGEEVWEGTAPGARYVVRYWPCAREDTTPFRGARLRPETVWCDEDFATADAARSACECHARTGFWGAGEASVRTREEVESEKALLVLAGLTLRWEMSVSSVCYAPVTFPGGETGRYLIRKSRRPETFAEGVPAAYHYEAEYLGPFRTGTHRIGVFATRTEAKAGCENHLLELVRGRALQ